MTIYATKNQGRKVDKKVVLSGLTGVGGSRVANRRCTGERARARGVDGAIGESWRKERFRALEWLKWLK
jgi:hypothetical protein